MTEELYNSIIDNLNNSLWGVVPFWAGILFLIAIIIAYNQSLRHLDLSSFRSLNYIFVVAFMLSFHTYIPKAIDALVYPAIITTGKLSEQGFEEKRALLDRKFDLVQKQEEKAAAEEDSSFLGQIKELIKKIEGFFKMIGSLLAAIPTAIESLLLFVIELLFLAVQQVIIFLSYFYRIVYSLFLPVCVSLSIIPAFRDNLLNWLKKYVIFALYIPIANIIGIIITKLSILSLEHDISRLEAGIEYSTEDLLNNVVYIGMLVCGIIGFFFIPAISRWSVQAILGSFMANKAQKEFDKLLNKNFMQKELTTEEITTPKINLERELNEQEIAIKKISSATKGGHTNFKQNPNHQYIDEILKYYDVNNIDINIKSFEENYDENKDIKANNASILNRNNSETLQIVEFFKNIQKLEDIYAVDIDNTRISLTIDKKYNNLYTEVQKNRLYLMTLGIELLQNEEDISIINKELKIINKAYNYSKDITL